MEEEASKQKWKLYISLEAKSCWKGQILGPEQVCNIFFHITAFYHICVTLKLVCPFPNLDLLSVFVIYCTFLHIIVFFTTRLCVA